LGGGRWEDGKEENVDKRGKDNAVGKLPDRERKESRTCEFSSSRSGADEGSCLLGC